MILRLFTAMLLSSIAVFVYPAHGQCNIRENVIFGDQIYSKLYVTVRVPDGRYISVPVVNGILPSIYEKPDEDGVVRTYTYTSGRMYAPGTLPSYKIRIPVDERVVEERKPEESPRPKPRAIVVEEDGDHPRRGGRSDSDELYDTKRALLELREEVKKLQLLTLKYETERKQPVVVPPTDGMVKPSELGKKKE